MASKVAIGITTLSGASNRSAQCNLRGKHKTAGCVEKFSGVGASEEAQKSKFSHHKCPPNCQDVSRANQYIWLALRYASSKGIFSRYLQVI